jgi:uncharacterized membrane protein YhaH (DUF805 family)
MSFSDAVSTCLRKYATFSGRARRSEYWWFALANVLVAVVAALVDQILGTSVVSLLVTLALLLPSLAVAVRRLHDTGRTGWWCFIALVPFVGAVVLLVFECLDSTPGDNQYGPSPKYVAGAPSVYA